MFPYSSVHTGTTYFIWMPSLPSHVEVPLLQGLCLCITLQRCFFWSPIYASVNLILIPPYVTFIALIMFSFPFASLCLVCVDPVLCCSFHCSTRWPHRTPYLHYYCRCYWVREGVNDSSMERRMNEESRIIYGDTTWVTGVGMSASDPCHWVMH